MVTSHTTPSIDVAAIAAAVTRAAMDSITAATAATKPKAADKPGPTRTRVQRSDGPGPRHVMVQRFVQIRPAS